MDRIVWTFLGIDIRYYGKKHDLVKLKEYKSETLHVHDSEVCGPLNIVLTQAVGYRFKRLLSQLSCQQQG